MVCLRYISVNMLHKGDDDDDDDDDSVFHSPGCQTERKIQDLEVNCQQKFRNIFLVGCGILIAVTT